MRINIVVTRQETFQPDGIIVVHSIQEALDFAEKNGESEAFIIGGGELFYQALPLANQLYLTYVHTDSQADTFFPKLGDEWEVISTEEHTTSDNDEYSTTFTILKRA